MTQEDIDRLYLDGEMPLDIWMSQNGRSTEWNCWYHDKIMDLRTEKYIKKREKDKRVKEAKEELEKKILEAIETGLEQSTDFVAERAANDIINSIDKAFNNKSNFEDVNKTYISQLGALVGRALGDTPFRLLYDILDEE